MNTVDESEADPGTNTRGGEKEYERTCIRSMNYIGIINIANNTCSSINSIQYSQDSLIMNSLSINIRVFHYL